MIYLESSIQNDKVEMDYDLYFGLQMYDESLSDIASFFTKLKNMLFGYIHQKKKIHEYYVEKSHMQKKLKAIKKLCLNKKIGNTKIVIRSYNDKLFKSTDINEQIQFAKNMFTGIDNKLNNPELYKYFVGYIDDRSSWDKIYEIKIKDVPAFFEMSIKNLDNAITTLESNVNDFSRYVDYQESSDASKRNIFTFFKSIKTSIKRRFEIIDMNFEIIQFKINQILHEDLEDELHKYVKEPSIKEQVSSAHKISEITYGGTTYNIYQTEYPNTSCFNYGGLDIYLDKAFFNLPKGYQLAILYHEIGHHQCGHFKPKGGLKKANLTVEEYNEIKKHPSIGKQILSNATIFRDIVPIVYYHHERYDGKGYPTHIKGNDIPFLARVVAVADTFDAMTSRRSYRDELDFEFVKDTIRKCKGSQFDPEVAEAFLRVLDNKFDKIKEIKIKFPG